MSSVRTIAVFVGALLSASNLYAQTSRTALLEQARTAYEEAQRADGALKGKPAGSRTRAEYVRVIQMYERVYVITPHTSLADDALLALAGLYEDIGENRSALRVLNFLVSEYPQSPFRSNAQNEIVRLNVLTGTTTFENLTVGAAVTHAVADVAQTSGRASEFATVQSIRHWELSNAIRVVIDLTEGVTFREGWANSPERFYIDIASARLDASLRGMEWPVESAILQKIRVGQNDNSTVRVVLDIGGDVALARRVTAQRLQDPDRIVIDINDVSAINAISSGGGSASGAPATVPATLVAAAAAAPPPQPDAIVTAAQPTSNGSHSLIRSLGLKLGRVVIDPGHGGNDTGSIGPTGLLEKELVLDIAKRLKAMIEVELGAEVVLTRSDDAYVPLETRTAIANRQEGDLFISIHANASRTASVRGVETFVLGVTTSPEVLETVALENAASGRTFHELEDVVRQIMAQDKADESRELAQHVQTALARRENAGMDRGVKQAQFVVLAGAAMPSVLTEISFISNPEEERRLKTSAYRQQIAESLLEGVRSYAETLSGLRTANIP